MPCELGVAYQKALFDADIPATALVTSDIQGDVERLKASGVVFRGEPLEAGTVTVVAFEDTCGNLIQLVQPGASRADGPDPELCVARVCSG